MKLTALFAALIAGSLVLSGCDRGPDQQKNTGASSSGGTSGSQSSSSGSTSGSQSQPANAPKRSQGKP